MIACRGGSGLRYTLIGPLLAGSLSARELNLIPAPRQIARAQGTLSLSSPVRITLAGDSPEDHFAVDLLVRELHEIHHLQTAVATDGSTPSSAARRGAGASLLRAYSH
jgi:hypothetical protein